MSYTLLDEGLQHAAHEAEASLSAFVAALASIDVATNIDIVPLRVSQAEACADAARVACREFELELKGFPTNTQDYSHMHVECTQMLIRLQQLLNTLNFVKRSRQLESLLAPATRHAVNSDNASPSALLALGGQVQKESQQAMERMTRVIDQSKQVGARTLASMEQQHSKLAQMNATVQAQQAQFTQAERELRNLVHQSLYDRSTRVLLALVLIAACIAITWRLSLVSPRPRQGQNGPGVANRGWRHSVLSPFSLLAE